MTKLTEEIYKVLLTYEGISGTEAANPLTASVCGGHAKAAAEVCKKYIEDFKDWYDKLSPAQQCTVWAPAGSGAGSGLYNMTTSDLVDKFLRQKAMKEKDIV